MMAEARLSSKRVRLRKAGLEILLLAATYYFLAQVGLVLPLVYGTISPVWPPAGVALAAVLLRGPQIAPGIFIGGFFASHETGAPFWSSIGIALANMSEVATTYYLLRLAGGTAALSRFSTLPEVLRLIVFGAFFSTIIGAIAGTFSLWASGKVPSNMIWNAFSVWWFGDGLGVLVVTPLFLVWRDFKPSSINWSRWLEAILLTTITALVCHLLFSISNSRAFAVLPLLIWAALRFGTRGATLSVALVSLISILYTVHGVGPFSVYGPLEGIAMLQTFIATAGTAALLVGTSLNAESERLASARSEAKFKALADSAPMLVWQCNRNGRCTYVNQSWVKFRGRTVEEELLTGWLKGVHPDDRKQLTDAYRDAAEKREPFRVEYRLRRGDGTYRWLLSSGVPTYDEAGAWSGYVGSAMDFTDRKIAEDQLKASEAQLRNIIYSNTIGVATLDGKGDFTGANDAFLEMLGYRRDEFLNHGINWRTLTPTGWEEADQRAVEQARQKGYCQGYEKEYLRKDGTRVPILISGAFIDRSINQAVIFALDLTEQKKTERSLRLGEQRLSLALSASRMGIWELDLRTQRLFWSPETEVLFGYLPGTPYRTFSDYLVRIHPEDRQKVLAARAKFISHKQSYYEGEFRILWPDGSLHWIADRGQITYDVKGQPLMMRGTVQDISNQRAIEEDLRQSEQRFKMVAELLPHLIWAFHPDGTGAYYNQRCFDYTGVDLWHAPDWKTLIHPEDQMVSCRDWEESLRTGKPYEAEYRIRRHDGVYRWHIARAVPLKDRDGTILHWFGTSTDVEDQKAAVMALKQGRDTLNEALVSRDEFLSIASHELKTPITGVKLHLALLKRAVEKGLDEKLTAEVLHQKLSRAEYQIGKLVIVIDSMLDLTRIRNQRFELVPESVELCSVVREVVSRLSEQAMMSECTIEEQYEGPLYGDWDRLRIEQVVTNLFSNAIKYGQKQPVRVTVRSIDRCAEIEVRDRGIGLKSEDRERIFERFERAAQGHSNTNGLGLGLFITKKIVDAHGGTIEVNSAVGKGSCFRVHLPLPTALISETRSSR